MVLMLKYSGSLMYGAFLKILPASTGTAVHPFSAISFVLMMSDEIERVFEGGLSDQLMQLNWIQKKEKN